MSHATQHVAPSSTPPPPTAAATATPQSAPESAVLAWFGAINRKDKAAAVAAFDPSASAEMNWGNGDPSTWPTFSALDCRPQSRTVSTAAVYCAFNESQAPAVGNPDSFWTVYLRLQAGDKWLITGYGQG